MDFKTATLQARTHRHLPSEVAKMGRRHIWLPSPQCEEADADLLFRPGLPHPETEPQAHGAEGERQVAPESLGRIPEIKVEEADMWLSGF